MDKVRVALIGHGHLGKWHAQKADLLETAKLTAIVDKSEANLKAAKEAFPNVNCVDDINKIWDDVDAVLIVTPTSFHYDLVLQAIEKGKHVFCEKPLCETESQAIEILKVAQEKDLVFQVGHSERFHQAWEMTRDYAFFKHNDCHIKINRQGAFKGRATDVDVIQDLMIHDVDLLLYLFDDFPTHVTSVGYKIRTDKWDYVSSKFEFKSGRVAEITVGRNYVKEQRSLEVLSKEGTLFVDLFANTISHAPSTQFENGDFVETVDYPRRDHLYLEQEHFYDSIINKKPPIIGFQDGLNAIKVLEKVNQSLVENKTVEI